MRIYFLKCITNKFHQHKKVAEILYIGKDSTGNRIYQHTFNLVQKQGQLYDYLNQAKENLDYLWELEEVDNKEQLAFLEKQLIEETQPQFNKYLKGKRWVKK